MDSDVHLARVQEFFNMYAISTQHIWIKVKIRSYQRHANNGELDTCSYGVHISSVYAYFSIIIIIIIIIIKHFFISHF